MSETIIWQGGRYPALIYRDFERALSWLETVLQFRSAPAYLHRTSRGGCAYLDAGTATVIICSSDFRPPDPFDYPRAITKISVEDLDQHVLHASQHGAKIHAHPGPGRWADRVYVVEDLDGYLWEITQQRCYGLVDLFDGVPEQLVFFGAIRYAVETDRPRVEYVGQP